MKFALTTLAVTTAASFSALASDNTLTVYTYDSFAADWGPRPAVEKAFEEKCGCDVNFVALEDGVSILNRLRLEGGNSKADVVLGLDQNLMAEAKKTGLLAEHSVDTSSVVLPNGWNDSTFVPYDFGYFSFIYNTETLSNPPKSLKELVEQRDASAASEDWLAQAQGFIDGAKDDNYAVLAALLAAKDAVTLQQYDKAAEQLTWVLSHAKEPAILAVTQLRLARVQREQGKLDEALATLGTAVPESFASAQAELKGDILLLADKPAEAKAAYQQALTNAGQNSQLLQIKLDELAHITAV